MKTVSDLTFVEVAFRFINSVRPVPMRIVGASITICESEVLYKGPEEENELEEFEANVILSLATHK